MAAIIKMRVSCCLHANSFLFIIARQNIYRRGVVPRGAGGATMAPPDFGRSVNPISTRGDRLCPRTTTGTLGFSDLSTTLDSLELNEDFEPFGWTEGPPLQESAWE